MLSSQKLPPWVSGEDLTKRWYYRSCFKAPLSVTEKLPRMIESNFTTRFAIDMAYKDLFVLPTSKELRAPERGIQKSNLSCEGVFPHDDGTGYTV